VETANQPGQTERPAGPLPPEVEAELRRRLQEQQAAPSGAVPALSDPPAYVADARSILTGQSPTRSGETRPGITERLKQLGPLGAGLVFLLSKLKFLGLGLKFGMPALTTGGTMLLSILVYAQNYGLAFAIGFVLSILVHEMGHVFVAWRMGVPVSAPIFIPFMGALILQKRQARSAWDEALIGIGGPAAGTLAGVICLLLYQVTRNPLFLGLAFTGFFLNLFNMIPIFPLDGGWITGAIHPRLWLVGIGVMGLLYAVGFLRNPFILVLILLSLPRLWAGLKKGDVTPPGGTPVTTRQRLLMGGAYVGLCALLVWLMAVAHAPV